MTNSRTLLGLDLLGPSVLVAGSQTLSSKGAGAVVKRVILGENALNLRPSERRMAERFRATMKELMSDL